MKRCGLNVGLTGIALVLEGALSAAGAVNETQWIGLSTGSWNDRPNWSAGVPDANTVAVVPVSGEMSITIPSGVYATMHGLRATGEGTLLLSGGNGLYLGKDANGECVVDVEAGVTVSADTTFQCASSGLCPVFVKKGAGVFNVGAGTGARQFGKNANWTFNGVEVREGELGVLYGNSDSDAFRPGGRDRIHVHRGAVLRADSRNWLVNWGWVDVDEGGLFDACGKNDFIGGVSGAGVASNLWVYTLSLKGGPGVFTGRIHCGDSLKFQPGITSVPSSNSTENAATPAAEAHFIVGPDALTNVKQIYLDTNCDGYDRLVQFAPGYPAEAVFNVCKLIGPGERPLHVEDTEGGPVTVRTTLNYGGQNMPVNAFVGCGNLVQSFNGWTYTMTNRLAVTGRIELEAAQASLQFGTGNPDLDAVSSASEIRLTSHGQTLYNNNSNELVTARVSGPGILSNRSTNPEGGVWTINELALDGGDIYPTVSNAVYVINGGSSTNVFLNSNQARDLRFIVNDGFLHMRGGGFNGGVNRRYWQTGGHVVMEDPISGWKDTVGSDNEVFFRMSGGVCESYTLNNYGRGTGVELTGDAYLKLRVGKASFQAHRISSDGYSHLLRVADRAVLDVDQLNFATGGSTEGYHGTLRLDGGVMRVLSNIYVSYSASSFPHGFDGRVYFNGGLLQSLNPDIVDWFGSECITGYVGAGGARVETSGSQLSTYVRFMMPLRHDPDCEGVDGGLVKTGRGALCTHGDASYTGPTRVTGGLLREDGSSTAGTPFGFGSVTLDDGVLLTSASASIATNAGATVEYDGVSAVGLFSGTDKTLDFGPFVRRGRGVLLLDMQNNASVLGGNAFVTTKDGMATGNGGLPAQPVFLYTPVAGYYSCLGFVTYDAERGFVPATCVDAFGQGEDSLVQISGTSRTLVEDVQIAGLDLRYRNGNVGEGGLIIGTGRTLTIGNGTGYAPLLLNSTSGAGNTPNQSIEGGTIDFGAAEGLVVSGPNANYGWWRPNKIKSVIAGTGGVTFAGGLSGNCRMDLELHGVNTWTGGAVIESLCVKPMVAGALSAGPVVVHGCASMGGGIWVESGSSLSTIANELSLSGNGCYNYERSSVNMQQGDYGALCVDRSVTVSGATTLAADTMVRARGNGTRLAFTGGVSGAGMLTIVGTGTVAPGAGNAYAGGTVIEGVAECVAADTFGTGPVEVRKGGVLRFVNPTPITLANDLSGEGEIVFAGAPVEFAGRNAFAGAIHGASALTGAGTSFVKDDDGVTALTAVNTYGGATEVRSGTLLLGPPPAGAVLPFAESVTAHVDASATDCMTLVDGEGDVRYVTEIRDPDGRGITWANTTEGAMPQYRAESMNGRGTLFFDGSRDRLISGQNVRTRAVFAVFRTPSGNHPVNWSCAGFFGVAGQDNGLRLTSGARTFSDDNWNKFGDVWINGTRTRTYPADTVCVGSFMMSVDVSVKTGVGNYWGSSSYDRTWWGDIAEVVCYDRFFDDDERRMVERHLAEKWGAELPAAAKLVNVLPERSAVTVAAGATIDLAGGDQTFTSLAGAGAVVNTAGAASTLTLKDGALGGFTGTIAGNTVLKIAGDVALDPAVIAVDANVDLVLGPGIHLDLNGGTLTVRNVSGSGVVKNGTLVVLGEDNRRDPATFIILR